jgi:hypothetical protein
MLSAILTIRKNAAESVSILLSAAPGASSPDASAKGSARRQTINRRSRHLSATVLILLLACADATSPIRTVAAPAWGRTKTEKCKAMHVGLDYRTNSLRNMVDERLSDADLMLRTQTHQVLTDAHVARVPIVTSRI